MSETIATTTRPTQNLATYITKILAGHLGRPGGPGPLAAIWLGLDQAHSRGERASAIHRTPCCRRRTLAAPVGCSWRKRQIGTGNLAAISITSLRNVDTQRQTQRQKFRRRKHRWPAPSHSRTRNR